MPQLAVLSRVPSASLLQNLFIFPSLASVTMYASAGGKTEIMTQGIFSLLLHISSPQLKHSKLLGAPHLMDCRHFGPCFLNISVDQERWHIHTGSQCFVELFWGEFKRSRSSTQSYSHFGRTVAQVSRTDYFPPQQKHWVLIHLKACAIVP